MQFQIKSADYKALQGAIFFWAAIGLLALNSGCERDSQHQSAAIATVASLPITQEDFLAALREREVLTEDLSDERTRVSEMHARIVLNDLIERRLILLAAEEANTIVSLNEVERAFQRFKNGWPEEDFEGRLKVLGLTAADYKRQMRQSLMRQKYFENEVYSRVAVTDEEIAHYLEAHPEMMTAPAQVHAKQIVVKSEDDATEVLQEMRKGMNFEDAAMKYSLGPEGQTGGDLGTFEAGVMPKVFDEVLFSMRPGQVSKMVASDYGFHLLKLVEKMEPYERRLTEVRNQVEEVLRMQKEAAAQEQTLKVLKQKYPVKINSEVLSEFIEK